MEFLGVGPLELLVILVVALIVVGPQRLPEIAAQMGRFMRAFQRYSSQVTREFSETMRDLEREYTEAKGDWREVGQGLSESAQSVHEELRTAGQGLSESAQSVHEELRAAGQDARITPEQTQSSPDGSQQAVTPPR